ncbi:two-component sensor histidine kinase [Capnocytophaga felis]|uniref:histidine kinase n=1 Tax=Capnocytophaga felis TaxID=2267611 RepID=A0A5M4B7C4_9FLAO|nr:two-component sensor histidine kinase [Capnocytophaga felis]GET47577.1 two-component sensor histidine kinase [Capnocytophaga felis]
MLGIVIFIFENIPFWIVIPYALALYVVCFFILQYRVEKFMYKRIKRIYQDVSLLESSGVGNKPITADVASLSKEINRFARRKKLEIETLKDQEKYRKEYIGNISHELNTPLFTVQSYILTLLDGAIEDKSVRKKYLSRAAKGVERLIYVVKDLEMISKLETGKLNLDFEEFDIIELIQNVFEMFEMQATKREISLIFDKKYPPMYVYADRERIQQVVANLIVNSIKYGKYNGTTEVSIESLPKGKIIVRVMDNGEGVIEENLSRLFERFYRVDKSGSRKEGGSGLGLSIVKHIIEAHKQKVFVDSVYGVGSEFSFTLDVPKREK